MTCLWATLFAHTGEVTTWNGTVRSGIGYRITVGYDQNRLDAHEFAFGARSALTNAFDLASSASYLSAVEEILACGDAHLHDDNVNERAAQHKVGVDGNFSPFVSMLTPRDHTDG